MNPQELSELIHGSIELAKMRGGKKESAKEEQITSNFAFATVVTINNVKKGELFTKENIWVKRPGIGEIKAKDYSKILGKMALNHIENDKHLRFSDVKK